MRVSLFLVTVGLGGAAILLSLGVWQVQRLAWKEGIIADIETRIAAEPKALPDRLEPDAHAYLPVNVQGVLGEETIRVLVSQKSEGAGYRLITALDTGKARILVDRGFIATDKPAGLVSKQMVTVEGNLQWPDEVDGFTPSPDISENIWFARDVPAMAKVLDTRPVLVVARKLSPSDPGVTPLPVDTTRIPNDHLQYAITWFSLAIVWLLMTATFLLRRRSPRTES